MRIIIVLLLLLVALIADAQWLRAAAKSKPCDQVLLSLVFPGIDSQGNAGKSVVIRSLCNDYDPDSLAGDMSVNIFNSLPISNGAHTDRLLVLDVTHRDGSGHGWGGQTLLALFRLLPKPRLLDVVDVRADRETYFWRILHAPQHDGVIVEATHLNAGEEFVFLSLVEVKGDRWVESKLKFPLINSFDSGTTSVKEIPALRQLKSAKKPAAVFTVKVTAQVKDPVSDVVKKHESKTFTARLNLVNERWRCPQCNSIQHNIEAIEKRFGGGNR
jgi:hypothetical protein